MTAAARPKTLDLARGFRVACVRTPEFALSLFLEWGAPVRGLQ